jgi:hypothetical protein
MCKASKGFKICELQKSINISMGFKLMQPWESSLWLCSKYMLNYMKIMIELHDNNTWIGLTEQVHPSILSALCDWYLQVQNTIAH